MRILFSFYCRCLTLPVLEFDLGRVKALVEYTVFRVLTMFGWVLHS